MKRIMALLMLCALCLSEAGVAEWEEGLGPEQPYLGVPAVDLSTNLGHILLYPGEKMQAAHYCGALKMYLPREDVAAGSGRLQLYTAAGEKLAELSFSDRDAVTRRPLTEDELEGLKWGGGICFEIRLPESLRLGEGYYVNMDSGCIVTTTGSAVNTSITSKKAWKPSVIGDYGVSGLRYAAPANKLKPEPGDSVTFDLVLGGEARTAVIYSDNDSIDLAERAYTASCTVTGTVLDEALRWGIVFLNGNDEVLTVVELER